MSEEIDYPSIGQQGQNLAKFTFEVLKEAFKGGQEKLFVNPDVQKKRLDVCRECPYFDGQQGRCKHCGCFLAYKVRFSLESCPLNKWGISDEDWMNGVYEQIEDTITNPEPEDAQPRFPYEKTLGTKYSWRMPEPDGRLIHWFWNGAMWQLDENPNELPYTDEEIEIYEENQRAMMDQREEDSQQHAALISDINPEVLRWKQMEKERMIAEGTWVEEEVEEESAIQGSIDSLIEEIAMSTMDELENLDAEVPVVDEPTPAPKKKRGRPKKTQP